MNEKTRVQKKDHDPRRNKTREPARAHKTQEDRLNSTAALQRAIAAPYPAVHPDDITTLQRTVGNMAVRSMLIQRKQDSIQRALSREQFAELKHMTRRALRRDMAFFYCPAGEDGNPVLVFDKREGIIRRMAKSMRKTAKSKVIVRGRVGNNDGILEFRTDNPVGKFKKHLKLYFGRANPLLRKAQIFSTEEYEARSES